MADSANPVSPKVKAAGIWGVLVPLGVAFVSWIVGILASPEGQALINLLPPWAGYVIGALVTLIPSLIAAYRKVDGLRIPTLDQTEVAKLSDAVDPIP